MPTTRSAKKRLRQNIKRRVENRSKRSALRLHIRRVRTAAEAGEIEKSEAEFRLAAKKLDRAAADRLIHPNAAARTKSRLAARIKAAKSPSEA
jgi:small subunit ribosomal protein S20